MRVFIGEETGLAPLEGMSLVSAPYGGGGRMLGVLAGKRAEIAGGVVMVLVGTAILYEHLSGAA